MLIGTFLKLLNLWSGIKVILGNSIKFCEYMASQFKPKTASEPLTLYLHRIPLFTLERAKIQLNRIVKNC